MANVFDYLFCNRIQRRVAIGRSMVILLRRAVYEVVPSKLRKFTFTDLTYFMTSFLFMSKASSLLLENTDASDSNRPKFVTNGVRLECICQRTVNTNKL